MSKVGNMLNNAGKVTTSMSVISGIFISILLLIGILVTLYFKKKNVYVTTNATIIEPSCESFKENICTKKNNCRTVTKQNCTYDLSFSVNGEDIIVPYSSEEKLKLTDGQSYTIEYNPSNFQDIRKPIPFNMILIILSIVFLITSGGTMFTYIMSKNRLYRQFHAGMTGYQMISSQFNNN